jgi:hypothetical protein
MDNMEPNRIEDMDIPLEDAPLEQNPMAEA